MENMLQMMSFLLPALAAGIGIAVIAGPLGCFIVWRRLAYFGDTLAHASLLGISIGLFLNLPVIPATIATSLILAALLVLLQRDKQLSNDTLLGILSHSALALGLVAISIMDGSNVNIYAYLFGDLLTVVPQELIAIYIIAAISMGFLIRFWQPLLSATLDENLAKVEGVNVGRLQFILMALIALVIAFAIKAVGILLITALLIIPAATSRRLSRSPEQMAIIASIIGILAVTAGLGTSLFWDTPAGPSIVLCTSVIFCISLLKKPHSQH